MSEKKLVIKRGTQTIIQFAEFPEGSIRSALLMDHDYIKVPFSTAEPIYFKMGDFADILVDWEIGGQFTKLNAGRFEVTDIVRPKYNDNTGGYDYELQMDNQYWKWKNKKMKFFPDSGSPELSFKLTASIEVHFGVFLDNLEALAKVDSTYLYNGKTAYTVVIDDTVDTSKAVLIEYDNISLIEVLNMYAEKWECEWWIVDNVIHFGKCEMTGQATIFATGANVVTMSQSDSKTEYATRLYVFGSERNLPANYRERDTMPTVNGIVQRRLMLPVGTPYIQDEEIHSEHEAVDAVVVFDEISPKVDCEVGNVSSYDDSVEEEDGTTTTQTFYRVNDTSGFLEKFTEDMILEGETLKIKFESGSMNGMEFDCQLVDNDAILGKCFEVVMNENYGRKLPDKDLHPKAGDKYVIFNWDSTKIAELGLVDKAEKELLDAGNKYLEKSKIDPSTYTCTMYSEWIENKGTMRSFDLGDKVELIDRTFFPISRVSRIIGYEWCLDIPYDSPQYIVGEKVSTGRIGTLEGKIDAITLGGNLYYNNFTGGSGSSVYILTTNDIAAPTERNVFSSLRSLNSFLRKDRDDIASGRITFKKQSQHDDGAQFGKTFVPGLIGTGGRIDGKGFAELRGLRLWEWAEIPEIRFNNVSVNIGLRIRAKGGGIIETVTIDTITDNDGVVVDGVTGSVHLKLEDGEFGAVEVDDLCMGLWHDINGGNSTENVDDHKGKFAMKGFKTVYFRITDIPSVDDKGADNSDQHYFLYALRPVAEGGSRIHPFAMMHFAQRGNPTDKERQEFVFETTSYELKLCKVAQWEFLDSNIYAISGILDGFTMESVGPDGKTYTKHFYGPGNVLGNAYIYGTIDQFERAEITMEIDTQGMRDLAFGESVLMTCKLYKAYLDVTDRVTRWEISRDSGDEANDAAWKLKQKVKDFNGSITIAFQENDNDLSLTVPVTMFTVKAYQESEKIAEAVLTI
ncbi:MAG: hypothetical protein Q4F85_06215 [Prevotella sp.]|nr:hypothetical protein [Prevotella sp.]